MFKLWFNDQRALTAIACMDMSVCCYDRWHEEKKKVLWACLSGTETGAPDRLPLVLPEHVTRGRPFISLD